MEKIRILCYGDSNTWGYASGTDHQRYPRSIRWPGALAKLLGSDFEIIEEGLNGRTCVSNEMKDGREGKSGFDYIRPCLDSHDPIDLVIMMLGTNELKYSYKRTCEEVGVLLEHYLVKSILRRKSQIDGHFPKLMIVAPPPLNEDANPKIKKKYMNATKKAMRFNSVYKKIAIKNGCYFVSNEGIEIGVDGIHLDEVGHKKLALKIYNALKDIYKL